MQSYSLTHLADRALTLALASVTASDRISTATVLAHIAEFDERRLYAPAGYPSTHAYCVDALRMSDDAAGKRIHAARTARAFPAIFQMVADGRLHLSAVVMLAPHLTHENADRLLAAATHKTRLEIERLLCEYAPRPDLPTRIQPVVPANPPPAAVPDLPLAAPALCETGLQHAPGRVGAPAPRAKVTPLAPERVAWQLTVSREADEKRRYAQALLGRPADLAEVIERALECYVQHLEQRRFAATSRARPRRSQGNTRYVPAEVRRAVWQRDQGQCTFVSGGGKRCESRTRLEFDHVTPVARGGTATPGNIRLRCRAHNLLEAERVFGKGFMQAKRDAALRAAADEVVPFLRTLGCRADEARRHAAAAAEAAPGAPLEDRVRFALRRLGPPGVRREMPLASSPV